MDKSKNAYYTIGDNCYVVDVYNKIKFCEVIQVYTELKECPVAYQLRDFVDYRYFVSAHENCFDSESQAKKFKSAKSGKKNTKEKIKRKAKKK